VVVRLRGLGVLLEAPAGAGKSSLALELVRRGAAALVADDAVDLSRDPEGRLVASAPHGLGEFLYIRGGGVFNLARLYGEGAVCPAHTLDLVLRFVAGDPAPGEEDPLRPARDREELLGLGVPRISIPFTWINDATAVDAVVGGFALSRDGYDAAADLEERLARARQ
jgi:HPr kinase/phosphorylase